MKNNLKNEISPKLLLKASSLINAIFVCIIVSAFCGCLVLISYYQNTLNNKLSSREDLINRNISSFNYFLNNSESIEYNKVKEIDVFDDGIKSYLEKKNWGFYDILVSKTVFKIDTITKIALVGNIKTSDNFVLYVTDYDKPLKLSGNTKIIGDIKIPNAKTEQAYINGQKGNSIEIKGNQSKSDDKLPKITKDTHLNVSDLAHFSIDKFNNKTAITNRFDTYTKVIDLNNTSSLRDITLKGNFILLSRNELEIDRSAKLSDVVIIAPQVKINSGFKGNIQIVSKEKVIVEENVSLLYPSSIYIKNDTDAVLVEIKSNSTIVGGIVINGNTYTNSLERKLTIEEGSTVVGNIYCYGSTQLKGNVIGSLYTDRFFLETDASNYENVVLNGSINKKTLPNNFVELPLFSSTLDKKRYAVIKEF